LTIGIKEKDHSIREGAGEARKQQATASAIKSSENTSCCPTSNTLISTVFLMYFFSIYFEYFALYIVVYRTLKIAHSALSPE